MPKSAQQRFSAKAEQELMAHLWSPQIAENPLNYVLFNYPWGKANTPLEHFTRPRKWQEQLLDDMAGFIQDQKRAHAEKQPLEVFRDATASGRGPGKSAVFAWLSGWMRSCQIGSTCVVTANSEAQLKGMTWGEMAKWHTLSLNAHWFDLQALSVRPAPWFRELVESQLQIGTNYYYTEARLWTEENPDAFAGVHNPLGVMLLYDEASGIPTSIWKVSEGYFTEPVIHRYWLAASNPRRNTGAFFECFHRNRKYWRTRHIDSRTVEGTDPAVYESIIEQYGPDSDEARVEVYGQFPHQGDKQFIGRDVPEAARQREVSPDPGAPLVLGVDVARFGDDVSVIQPRAGRDARTLPVVKFKGLDTVQLARRTADFFNEYPACQRIFVDGNGVGGGVVDMLRDWGYPVEDVQSGGRAEDDQRFANKRAEMWALMKEWLGEGCIAHEQQLYDDLVGPEYSYDSNGRILLERKDQMKKRGLASPDFADALALTFAQPVARMEVQKRHRRRSTQAIGAGHDPLGRK